MAANKATWQPTSMETFGTLITKSSFCLGETYAKIIKILDLLKFWSTFLLLTPKLGLRP